MKTETLTTFLKIYFVNFVSKTSSHHHFAGLDFITNFEVKIARFKCAC